jgi:ABC-type dipeptide/oligopeptide/nickel transport system ATPase component
MGLLEISDEDCKRLNVSPGQLLIKKIVERRFEAKKNTVILLVGDTGEGKSYCGAKIAHTIEPKFNYEKQMIYHAGQYKNFMELTVQHRNLFRVAFMDEAHTSMPARKWYDFVVYAITTVNAMIRQLKPLCMIMTMPSIKWLESLNRELVNYYGICTRASPYSPVKMKLYKFYTNREDVEHSRLYKKKLRYIHNGRIKTLSSFQVVKPGEDIIAEYEMWSKKFKADYLKEKLFKLIDDIERVHGSIDFKTLADFYFNNENAMKQITTFKQDKTRIDMGQLSILHPNLERREVRELASTIQNELMKRGLSADDGK